MWAVASIVIAALAVGAVILLVVLGYSVSWLLTNVWNYPRLVDAVNFVTAGVLIYCNWDN